MTGKKAGSCLCKQVHFEIEGNFDRFYLCHCDRCRKDTGSAHAANLFSWTARLKWISGQENVKTFQLPATRYVRSFCTTCGSAMPNLQMEGKLLVVPAGSLDDRLSMIPTAHINISDKADWDEDLEKIPRFAELPG